MRCFVTGTGTDVGKTLVSAWICLHTGASYFKPVQTGASSGTDSQMVHHLAGVPVFLETFCWPWPVSPDQAASRAGTPVDLNRIVLPEARSLVTEGAGGVLVPLTPEACMADLMALLGLPVLLVALSGLGTLNHTLLSLEALARRSLVVQGIIMNGDPHPDNERSLERHGGVPVLARIPRLQDATRETLAALPLTDSLRTFMQGDQP